MTPSSCSLESGGVRVLEMVPHPTLYNIRQMIRAERT